ncbi:MAG: amino acid ABC transporter ATP-binding protein, partial [Vallitaleaceae bacterium]|nr:amino acid ABC transporter ATP-binding protein [Vallitaleaceae bacterium]
MGGVKVAIIHIEHLSKSFGTHQVLKDIDFSIERGEVVCIIGSSGSGKSTLLRCINLLEVKSSGTIYFHQEEIGGTQKQINEYRSKVGMVFQSFNLFNNMTVLENCMSGCVKVQKKSKEEAHGLAIKYLKKV